MLGTVLTVCSDKTQPYISSAVVLYSSICLFPRPHMTYIVLVGR